MRRNGKLLRDYVCFIAGRTKLTPYAAFVICLLMWDKFLEGDEVSHKSLLLQSSICSAIKLLQHGRLLSSGNSRILPTLRNHYIAK
jgi:hypothetical protein